MSLFVIATSLDFCSNMIVTKKRLACVLYKTSLFFVYCAFYCCSNVSI